MTLISATMNLSLIAGGIVAEQGGFV